MFFHILLSDFSINFKKMQGKTITVLSTGMTRLDFPPKDGNADQTTHHAMHEALAVSRAAVSQMLGSLEKRGYIRREIDRDNRRKIIITGLYPI
jgi:CRP-like cAMP-binding protein